MKYYLKNQRYRIHPNGQLQFGEEYNFSINDRDGTALATAEQKFFAHVSAYLQIEEQCFGVVDTEFDELHVQEWYVDKQRTMLALRLTLKTSQVLQEIHAGIPTYYGPKEMDIRDAILLGEAIVPNNFTDVFITRERLYRTPEGGFVLETSRQSDKLTKEWHSSCATQTIQQAIEWSRQHLEKTRYERWFGDVPENIDRVPCVLSLRQDCCDKLDRLVSTTGKQRSLVVEAAINEYYAQHNAIPKTPNT
jgi:hypothetical protein